MRKLESKTEPQQDEDLSKSELGEDVTSAEIDAWIEKCFSGLSNIRLSDDFYRGRTLAAKKLNIKKPPESYIITFSELEYCAAILSDTAKKLKNGRSLTSKEQNDRALAFRVSKARLHFLEDLFMLPGHEEAKLTLLRRFTNLDREYFPEPVYTRFIQIAGAAFANYFLHTPELKLIATLELEDMGFPFLNAYRFVLDEAHLPERLREDLMKKFHSFAEQAGFSTYLDPEKFAVWYQIGEIIATDAASISVVSDEQLDHHFVPPLLSAFKFVALECNMGRSKFFDGWYNSVQNEIFTSVAPFFATYIKTYYDNEIGDGAARRIAGYWHEADESNSAESVRQNLNALEQLDASGERFPNLAHDLFGIVCPAQVGVSQIIEQIKLVMNGNKETGYGIELRSRYDWMGSFANRRDDRDELKKKTGMPIIVLEADNLDEAALLMQPIREKLGRASFLTSYSHGSKKHPQMDLEHSHHLSKYREALEIIDNCLIPTAPIFLHWCSAGLSGGVAQGLSVKMKGRRIIALRAKSAFQEQKVRIVKGQPIITLKATQATDKVTIRDGRIYERRHSTRPPKHGRSIVPKSRLGLVQN